MKLSCQHLLTASVLSLAVLTTFSMSACTVKQPQESVGQYVDGGVMTTSIKSKILADEHLRNTSISVKTYKSEVQLSGIVHNLNQKMLAEHIARTTEGVTQVDNSIIIKN